MGQFQKTDITGNIHNPGLSPIIKTVSDDITITSVWHKGILSIATDAKTITLANSCPVGMELTVINTGTATNVLVTVVGSSTVGIGGRNQVIGGTSQILTKVVGKELRNTKGTAAKFDYVVLTKRSLTEWDAVTHGIWVKEG